MVINKYDMSVDYAALGSNAPCEAASLTSYILSPKQVEATVWDKRPAVIVCPGGGYRSRSMRESEPVVMKYCAAGFHSFLMDYSVAPTGWPAPLCELSKAVKTVRSLADEYPIDTNKIFVCGFSAGGHLAASLGVHGQNPIIKSGSGISGDENMPNGLILCYPVITGDDGFTHRGTRENFSEGMKSEKLKYFSLEKFVTPSTPKSFIWHTFEDDSVPVYSSMRFAEALLENGVEYELHIYPSGRHGLALGERQTTAEGKHFKPYVSNWIDMSIEWINR